MKRFVSLVMSVILVFSLAACGSNDTGNTTASQSSETQESSVVPEESDTQEESLPETSAIDFDEEPYTLVVCYPVLSEAQPDLAMIQEAINEITLREINARVEFEAVGLFSMANVYALKASSQEKVDLMMLMPGYNYLPNFATSNMIQPIDDVVEAWGPSIKEILGDALQAGRFNGSLYAVPQNKDLLANGYGFNLSVPLCEKYDIDIDSIKTLEDLEAVFELIHEKEPDVTVVAPEQSGGTILSILRGKTDPLGTTTACLSVAADGTLQAVNSVEQERYSEAAKKVREWYEKGYISRDVTTAQESGSQMLGAGKVFATAAASLGASMGGEMTGVQFKAVKLEDVFATTSDSQMSIWTIPTSCQRPDKAIQFLNLAFENEEIGNLFRYGIADNHHVLLEDGSAQLANTAGWVNNWYIIGDYNKMYIRSDAIASAGVSHDEYMDLTNQWNEGVVLSPAYGFTFDPAAVRTEVAACDTVIDEYSKAIGNGVVDPEAELPKFRQKLIDAGVEIIMSEVQRQLDEWAAMQ